MSVPNVCPMVLAYIKPVLSGFEVRTWAGAKCDHIDQVVTETGSRQ